MIGISMHLALKKDDALAIIEQTMSFQEGEPVKFRHSSYFRQGTHSVAIVCANGEIGLKGHPGTFFSSALLKRDYGVQLGCIHCDDYNHIAKEKANNENDEIAIVAVALCTTRKEMLMAGDVVVNSKGTVLGRVRQVVVHLDECETTFEQTFDQTEISLASETQRAAWLQKQAKEKRESLVHEQKRLMTELQDVTNKLNNI